MHHEEFYLIALRIWGENWPAILADKFEVRPKSVKRWASGKNPIPEAVQAFIKFHQARINGGVE